MVACEHVFPDTNLGQHIKEVITSYAGEGVAAGVQDFLGQIMWHPKDASLTQIYAAVGPAIREGRVTGKYFHPIARETAPDPHARNATLQAQLWAMTEEFIATHK